MNFPESQHVKIIANVISNYYYTIVLIVPIMEFSFSFDVDGESTHRIGTNSLVNNSMMPSDSSVVEENQIEEVMLPNEIDSDVAFNNVQTVLGSLKRVSLKHIEQAGDML